MALLSVWVARQTMDRLPPLKKEVKTAIVEEMVAAIMYFCHTDPFHGKRKAEVENEAQMAAVE